MHTLLERQLKRFFKTTGPLDPALESFARAVDEAYRSADIERTLLEKSLELSSRELQERYEALQMDIRAREQAESERDSFFRMSPDLLCILNRQLVLVQVNPSWTRLLGFSVDELLGRPLIELVHPEDQPNTLEQASQLVSSGALTRFESRCRTTTGDWKHLAWTATVDTSRGLCFCVARDVTAQRAMEKDLAQAQKLEAVGQLAAGVAHEINTPIQFIGDNSQFLADSFTDLTRYLRQAADISQQAPPGADALKELRELAQKIDLAYLMDEIPKSLLDTRDGIRRVAELVKALKEYAHPDNTEMAPGDINEALQRTLVLARNELKYVADIELDLATLPAVHCHIGSLQQVFLNLLVNAGHAIEERNKGAGANSVRGTIRVATRLEGGEVIIDVRDSGCGIPAAIRDRIFEPFFTTKPMGKGSGQGLPLVRSVIVEKHQGKIEVDSQVGQGTTFTLRLPAARVAA